jgi:molecular chaperone GrpE
MTDKPTRKIAVNETKASRASEYKDRSDDRTETSIDGTDAENGDAEDRCEDRSAALEKEAKDNYDRYLRIAAEFENFKKRTIRETEDFRKYANESLLKEMLPVVDNLERAIDSASANTNESDSLVKGVDLTLKEILRVFEKFGVTPIDCLEKPFDPAYHQAVLQEESDAYPENTVIREFQRGYMIRERLLRPAMVVVSKAKATKTVEGAKNGENPGERD